ncbi:MAG TPA: TonB family protein [Nitrospirales bacterium]|nr:TonB family protein [Nitrospirales bacterium]
MTLATLTALSMAPNHCRIQAWAWSTILHGLCVGFVLFLITDFQPPAQSAPLRLDMGIIKPIPPEIQTLSTPQERPQPTPVHNKVIPEKMVSPTPVQQPVTTEKPIFQEHKPLTSTLTQEIQDFETVHMPKQQHTQEPIQTKPTVESTLAQELIREPVRQIFAQSAHSRPVEHSKPIEHSEPVEHSEPIEQSTPIQQREPSPILRNELSPQSRPTPVVTSTPSTSVAEPMPVTRPEATAKLQALQTSYQVVEPTMTVTKEKGLIKERPTPQIHHRTAVVERSLQTYPEAEADYGWLAQAIWGEVEKYKRYPRKARQQEWEGKVVLEAVIRMDGTILNLRVAETSGHEILDEDALSLLWKLSPLTLKHSLGRPQLTILVPLTYQLDG